jgi:hypothetical protein
VIAEHEAAFAYDWRTRFGLPLAAVFDGRMTWGETWALTQVLLADPSSQVSAAVAGWRWPMSRESLALADLWDLTFRMGKKAGSLAYPRPWAGPKTRIGDTGHLSQDRIRAELAARGHGVAVPVERPDRTG